MHDRFPAGSFAQSVFLFAAESQGFLLPAAVKAGFISAAKAPRLPRGRTRPQHAALALPKLLRPQGAAL